MTFTFILGHFTCKYWIASVIPNAHSLQIQVTVGLVFEILSCVGRRLCKTLNMNDVIPDPWPGYLMLGQIESHAISRYLISSLQGIKSWLTSAFAWNMVTW